MEQINQRTVPSASLLRAMILDVVENLVAEYEDGGNQGFTAYTVTLALRSIYPNSEVMNGDVGPIVYEIMTGEDYAPNWSSMYKAAPDGRLATHWMKRSEIVGPQWDTEVETVTDWDDEEYLYDDDDDFDDESLFGIPADNGPQTGGPGIGIDEAELGTIHRMLGRIIGKS